MNKDVLICGVGGQGTILASKLLAAAAMEAGSSVHSAETIGMAQRGGSVTSHVRIGDAAYSPLIPMGCADLLMAFEPAEAVRNLGYLKKDGVVIVNSVPVKPVTESLQDTGYDGTQMIEYLKGKCSKCIVVNSQEMCAQLGSEKFFNVVILGVAVGSGALEITGEEVIAQIETRVNAKFIESNKKAFEIGRKAGEMNAVK